MRTDTAVHIPPSARSPLSTEALLLSLMLRCELWGGEVEAGGRAGAGQDAGAPW